ncbi:integrator complex subunit 8 [Harpegnathos saltator]|uniref:Integrator complex subunit 8 n=1 Tax=Harpegnathos saltator TaxID=610380 RepID=E2BWB0_HARSA|nr:integrator complex subunit 8 [Harpegnathos saltator]EFN80014.1 Integrator complex subunit 8 [Harpegnathos saltator]
MDVDLLRPGTVPISPDTILWFEFLLNPSLLQKHLSKPFPDPSPTDLIIKFMTINSDQKEIELKTIDTESNDVKPNGVNKWSHRNLALKILSLKVAAYLKWDLDILEKKLPLPIQLTLLQDLFYITSDVMVEIPTIPEFFIEKVSDQLLFTLVLYHRWHLRAIIYRALSNKQPKQQLLHIPGFQESTYVPPGIVDDIIRKLEAHIPNSVSALNTILEASDIKPMVLSFDTFQMLTEDSIEIKQNWENMYPVNIDEFKCQIHYDLAMYYLLREEYQDAKCHIRQAKERYSKLDSTVKLTYCKVQKEFLEGACLACEVPIENITPSLTQRLQSSIKDQYTNILQILQTDNVFREIPQVYRDNLELDIQGGSVNRKIIVARDLLLQIQCLNLVRKILDDSIILGDYVTEIKAAGSKGLDVLFWALNNVIEKASPMDKKRISRYLLYLINTTGIEGLALKILNDSSFSSLFDETELAIIKQASVSDEIELPNLLLNNDWGISPIPYIHNTRIEVFELEQKLIATYDSHEIRETLIHLDGKHRMKPLWNVNGCWELPIPLQSVVMSLSRGFMQDYSYVLLAKSRELVMFKNFDGAIELLKVLDSELQEHMKTAAKSQVYKLCKLVSWECLLVEIWKCLHTWPTTNVSDMQSMVARCKQCLGALQATDQVIPRQEIIEYCTVFLLNMAEWDYLTSLEKRWSYTEFAAAVSSVCQDIVKYKGTRKFPREAWDMILAAFGPSREQTQKRSGGSGSGGNSGSSGSNASRDVVASITSTLTRLREPMVLTVVISLLARLRNVLRDESSLELHTQYLTLWPAGVPNANSYNIRYIGEILFQLLIQALKYYPCNVPWLRLMGDLNFVLAYYESAMKYYLKAIMVASDLFSQPILRTQIDDLVYRRMIKCCAHLQCYTQAAILCQFLEEVDYSLAFKMASSDQKNCATADAMDAYYHCIWDITLLEYLIHQHAKRGEHHRKQLAIKVIGLLELNSNNNEEIQREAANIRKAKFLRALAKQYVY